ncbi:MAG TPA: AMP-binding protein [Micromonospora sp.]
MDHHDQTDTPASGNYVRRALELFGRYDTTEAITFGDLRFDYGQVRGRVLGTARALLDGGLRPGSAVLVLARNPPEVVFLQFALHLLGCRTVWMNPRAPHPHRTAFVRSAEVDAFVYDTRSFPEERAETLATLAESGGVLRFSLGPDGVVDLLAAPSADTVPLTAEEVTGEPQSLLQTSGTTDDPKSVHHRHSFFRGILTFTEHYQATDGRPLRHLAQVGFWQVSGQVAAMMTLFAGGTLVMQEGWDLERFLTTIEQDRITSALVSPQLLYQILDHPLTATTDLSSLHMLSIGGSPAAPTRLRQAIERLGPVVRLTYGMSECTFITVQPDLREDPEHPERLASCGRPYGDVELEIRDAEGQLLPPGLDGEIWVRSSLMMAGYWRQPELTAYTLVDGWLRTGDIGHQDPDGYLYIVDRAKDMIITGYGAEKVYCRPVEDVLMSHPAVASAAVLGIPTADHDEAVYAFVVRHPGAEVTADDLRQLVLERLFEVYEPREVVFVDAFPLTGTAKVDKKALRADYLARVGAVPA